MCEDLEEANDKANNYEKNVSDSAITYSEVSTTVALHRVKIRRDGNRTDANCSSLEREPYEDNKNSVNLPQSVHVQPEPPPLRSEVARAIDAEQLINHPDPMIPHAAELFKKGGETILARIHQICLANGCNSVFVPLPKKRNLKQCTNYRTIALVSNESKLKLFLMIGTLLVQSWQTCEDWYTVTVYCYSVSIVKNSQKTVKAAKMTIGVPIVTCLPRLYQVTNPVSAVYQSSKTVENIQKTVKIAKITIGVPIVTCLPRLYQPCTNHQKQSKTVKRQSKQQK